MIITIGILYFLSLFTGMYFLSILGSRIDDKQPIRKESSYSCVFPLIYGLAHSLISLQLLYNYLKL